MATLKAMFKLFDGYSSTINKIVSGTDKATGSVLKASNNTDKFNDSLRNTGASASVASSGLSKLVGAVVTLASAKKGMDLTDSYTNTAARLKMINDESQTQLELQNKIFAAADRARGSYTDMASAVAKMNLLAGDSFKSNDEAIGFTELLQKSLKVSGAGKSEQDSAFLQLSQAMAAGKLQGDEFRSVMENAPMVANAIASYMGKSKGELKELSSKGAITADIIKGAMFAAADDINTKFKTMPITFSDVWTRIKNTGNQAFGNVFGKLNAMLNSESGQQMVNVITAAIFMAADACNALLDAASGVYNFISDNWSAIAPIVTGIATAFMIYATYQAISTATQWAMNSAMLACPVFWIAAGIGLVIAVLYAGIAAVNHFTGTSISATGLIGAAFGVLYAVIYNTFLYPFQVGFALVANFIGNVFNNPVGAVKVLFLDMANTCISYILNMAKAIENIINKIPGVTVDITSGLDNLKAGIEKKTSKIKDETGWKEYVKQPELMDITKSAAKGYKIGSGIESGISGLLGGLSPDFSKYAPDFSKFATSGNPATIKGTGKGGAVKVENQEDINWLRKLAERDFVARIASNTLAPSIKVEFSGPITKEADTDGVAAHIGNILKDQIATAAEGVY
ncbi:tape measure protein [Lacrimispora sp.]|uniref:tape measure protein n=1 Tax=Lacrimispora sp. TaxID=2719234 RepID=UPI0028A17FDE|nr:tape measure protein [Lacrimispora sp.]